MNGFKLTVFAMLSAGLVACGGEDGNNGAQGAVGPQGPQGA
tara:strand:+ start:5039 stop:5161 length:123 start_codon:yes stop_codon:yes gene_type:complete